MNKINILDNKTINKIAAGEVVERPLSVIKELVENSIDAKANAITVEIKDGGTSLIRVTDNGMGIPKDEVKIAFIRHATSKIKTEEDLSSILSLGFRGEALASIASVSMVEVITKESDALTGYRMEINGGELIEEGEIGCPEGTTMIVKNLFYNTPARKKFLKSNSSEANGINDIITKLAIGHPEISFKYINNNKVVFLTSGNGKLKDVIYNIYGKDVVKKIMNIAYVDMGLEIYGYIAKPEINRSTRVYENVFVNGRYIKSKEIESAIEEAYKEYLMVKRFPFAIIKININPAFVDVNVHPAKIEVRFKNVQDVKDIVRHSIKNVLKDINMVLDIDSEKEEKIVYKREEIKEPFEIENLKVREDELKENGFISQDFVQPKIIEVNNDIKEREVKINYDSEGIATELVEKDIVVNKENLFLDYKIVGQIFETYWVIESMGKVYAIDQHAAHEKILYENMLKQFLEGKIKSQVLINPIIVDLSQIEFNLVKSNISIFEKSGFKIEVFGTNSFAIREVPIIFNNPTNDRIFLDIVDEILQMKQSSIYELKNDDIATMACKAAVKANNKLSIVEARKLIEDLMLLENPFHCPHGRPVIISISKYEIEKKFKRIV